MSGGNAFCSMSKKKSKMPAIDRYSQLWIPRAPKLMVVGARVNLEELREIGFDEDRDNLAKDDKGNFLLTGDRYQEAVNQSYLKESIWNHSYFP